MLRALFWHVFVADLFKFIGQSICCIILVKIIGVSLAICGLVCYNNARYETIS